MDVYELLNGAAFIFGAPATLHKKSGETITVNITPHDTKDEQLSGRYPSAVGSSVYSVAVDELRTSEGKETRPEEGDTIETTAGGVRQRYKVVKDANSARTWDWLWDRPGVRVKFYVMSIKEEPKK